jgi:hypothetical protein
MYIYSGIFTDTDTKNELNEIKAGHDTIVIFHWTKTDGGDEKKNGR